MRCMFPVVDNVTQMAISTLFGIESVIFYMLTDKNRSMYCKDWLGWGQEVTHQLSAQLRGETKYSARK